MKNENKDLINSLAVQADILNTINGGVIMPTMKMRKQKKGYALDVKVAGVDSESMRVEVIDNELALYYLMNFGPIPGIEAENVEVAYFIRILAIPREVSIPKIKAFYKNGHLRVMLPYNEFANGYQRSVDIENKE